MRLILIILVSLLLGPAASAQDDGLNRFSPLTSVLGLASGPQIEVIREAGALSLVHDGRVLMHVSPGGFRFTDEEFSSVGQAVPAYVEIVREPVTGKRMYTLGITGRGARLLIIEKGQVNKEGLHVLSFDNDDVHVSDGSGRLIYSRRTDATGRLYEKNAACGCTRVTTWQGVQHVWRSLNELAPVH
jgi:hypothetical protein